MRNRRLVVTACTLLALVAPLAAGQEPDAIRLATWNVRILSHGSRDDTELAEIAGIIKRYDFVAIQELRDTRVLGRLMGLLPGYAHVVSEPVGRSPGRTERYAFVYRTDLVDLAAPPETFPDPADWFIREPFVGHFRAGEFDFTLITVHVLFGDGIGDRRQEIARLDDVLRWADTRNGPEEDVLLVGDFNVDVADRAWEMEPWVGLVSPDTMTTITDTSSYDNIWYNPDATTELRLDTYQVFRFDEELFGNDDKAAYLAVSDHRPVSISFSTAGPDDDGDPVLQAGPQPAQPIEPGTEWPGNEEPGNDGTSTMPIERSEDVGFLRVVAHPTDAESVTLVNRGRNPVNLSGWRLGDLNDPLAYRIPSGTVLEPAGTRTFSHTTLPFGINNAGERLFLRDANGVLVDEWSN